MLRALRKSVLPCLMTLAMTSAGAARYAGADGFTELFNGKDLAGWKSNVFGNDDVGVFSVKDGVIVVGGKPNGYFYTDKSYKNYILRFDWKFIKDGNGGLLVHIQGHGKGWPKSLEIQGLQRDHANVIGIGIKTSHKVDKAAQKKAIKIGEWNTTEVTIKDGDFTAQINGTPITTGKILTESVKEGPIGFQSEGTELHYKNIKIKVLD